MRGDVAVADGLGPLELIDLDRKTKCNRRLATTADHAAGLTLTVRIRRSVCTISSPLNNYKREFQCSLAFGFWVIPAGTVMRSNFYANVSFEWKKMMFLIQTSVIFPLKKETKGKQMPKLQRRFTTIWIV